MRKILVILLSISLFPVYLLSFGIAKGQSNYKSFVVQEVIGFDKILISDGIGQYIVDYDYSCNSFDFYSGQTIYIDTFYSPSFYDSIILDSFSGVEECKVSSSEKVNLKTYFVEKELDSGDKIVVRDNSFNKYIVEYGVGCLSMWRYENNNIHIDIGGALLDGISDTIYLFDSDDDCRVWNVQDFEERTITAPQQEFNFALPASSPVPTSKPTRTPTSTPNPTNTPTPSPMPTDTATPTPTGVSELSDISNSNSTPSSAVLGDVDTRSGKDYGLMVVSLIGVAAGILYLSWKKLYLGKDRD